jgi:Asp-tRNA(Asn)/Glu-tRNA(Gln) amidotransferase A subunit family amidase
MTDLVLESASSQLEFLRTGKLSVVELGEAHIRQIERLNPQLNALVDFDPDRVRKQALVLDNASGQRGPLHGLPVTVKSSIAVSSYRCEIGSRLNAGDRPQEDAEAVKRLRNAGALILGTTNCPEFLMAYETANLLHGCTSNPWALDRSPGGSSGGEAAAIAAGLSAAGLGSDSGGSVRQPAHATGICALKPTPGRIPARGHLPPCAGPFSVLGAIGPMARTMADISLLFQTLSGQDSLEAGSPPIAPQATSALRRQTIGFFEDDGLTPVTQETRAAVQSAAQALQDAGFRVEPFRPRSLELLRQLWWKLFIQCGAMLYEPAIRGRREELSPIFQEFLGIAESVPPLTASQLLDCWVDLDLQRARMLAEMAEHPILLCPVSSIPAFRHGERSWLVGNQTVEYLDAMRFTQWFNVLGAPAAVVPVSRSAEGLPVGVQIVAQPFHDETAIAVAAIVDHSFGYQPPPMAQETGNQRPSN